MPLPTFGFFNANGKQVLISPSKLKEAEMMMRTQTQDVDSSSPIRRSPHERSTNRNTKRVSEKSNELKTSSLKKKPKSYLLPRRRAAKNHLGTTTSS